MNSEGSLREKNSKHMSESSKLERERECVTFCTHTHTHTHTGGKCTECYKSTVKRNKSAIVINAVPKKRFDWRDISRKNLMNDNLFNCFLEKLAQRVQEGLFFFLAQYRLASFFSIFGLHISDPRSPTNLPRIAWANVDILFPWSSDHLKIVLRFF